MWPGGRPPITRSASCAANSDQSRSLLPTSSRRSTAGWQEMNVGERGRQEVFPRGGGRGDPHPAALRVAVAAGGGEPLLVEAEDGPRIDRVGLAGGGQAQAPAVPLDQRHPTSRASADRAADTADSVTVSRRAASRTDPASATVTSARNRATVVTGLLRYLLNIMIDT